MPFIPLEQPDEPPSRGFVPLAESQPKRGFTPLQETNEAPSILKTAALENPATAIAETGLNLASQAVALPVAGLAGLATEAGKAMGLTERKGADVVHAVGEKLTYVPRSELGKAATEIATYPFQKLAEAGQWAGGKTLEATDSPALATAVDTTIQGVLPMIAGPLAKKGSSAVKERIGKAEATPEAISPEAQATNVAPATVEAARPAESALARNSVISDVADGQREQGAPSLAQHDQALLRPQESRVEALRSEGDNGLPGVDQQLRAVSEGRGPGAEPQAVDMAGTTGRDEGVRAWQRGVDESGGSGEPARVLPARDGLRQADDGGAGFEIAGAAEQGNGGPARGARNTARDAGESSTAAPDIAGVQRQTTVDRSSRSESWNDQGGGSVPAARGLGDRASGVRPEEARPQPILDPNAGPLSRSAAVARPDLVV